jgi:hypothetical protein
MPGKVLGGWEDDTLVLDSIGSTDETWLGARSLAQRASDLFGWARSLVVI